MTLSKQDLKLLKFWLRKKLKPFVRIEPEIKHLNNEYWKAKELLKVFQSNDFRGLHKKLSVQEILNLKLPKEDQIAFLKLFQPKFFEQLEAISQ